MEEYTVNEVNVNSYDIPVRLQKNMNRNGHASAVLASINVAWSLIEASRHGIRDYALVRMALTEA